MVVRKWWSGLFLSEVNTVRHTKMSLFWIPRQVIKRPYQVEKDHNLGFFWTCGTKILRSKITNYYEHKKYKTLLLLRSSITTAHDNFYTFSHTITGIDFPRNGTRDSSTFIWFENGQVTRENKVTMKKEKAGKLAKLTSSKARKGTLPALLSIIIIVCYGKHCKWCCSGFYTPLLAWLYRQPLFYARPQCLCNHYGVSWIIQQVQK